MKKVEQTRHNWSGDPVEESGNCYAACVASIFELELEDMPYFRPTIDPQANWDRSWGTWFGERGLTTYYLAVGAGALPNKGYTIGSVMSVDGNLMHPVVCRDGKIVWDPQPKRASNPYVSSEVMGWEVFVVLDPAQIVKGSKEADEYWGELGKSGRKLGELYEALKDVRQYIQDPNFAVNELEEIIDAALAPAKEDK